MAGWLGALAIQQTGHFQRRRTGIRAGTCPRHASHALPHPSLRASGEADVNTTQQRLAALSNRRSWGKPIETSRSQSEATDAFWNCSIACSGRSAEAVGDGREGAVRLTIDQCRENNT